MKIQQQKQAQLLSPLGKLSQSIGALLLLLLFLSVSLIEIFHHHESQEFIQTISQINHTVGHDLKNNREKTFSSSVEKCKLCEMMKHRAVHFYIAQVDMAILIHPLIKKETSLFHVQSSSGFILQCANKGPPAIFGQHC